VPERPREAATWQRAVVSTAPCRGSLRVAVTLGVLAIASLAGAIAFVQDPLLLRYPDAYDYAQMGRQLAEGQGLTSLQVFPYVVGWLDAAGFDTTPPWPVLWRFPLPILARAFAFQSFGATDAAALAPALLFSVLTAPALFLLTNRIGGCLAGLLAAGLWIASASQQQFALTGLTEPGAALIAVAIAGAAIFARDGGGSARCLALGAALGAAFLQRTNLLALAPAALLLVMGAPGLSSRARAARLGATISAALLVASPWLLRNALGFGDPLLNLTSDRGLLRLGLGSDPFYAYQVGDRATLLRESLALYPSGWTSGWVRENGLALLGRDFMWLLPCAAAVAWMDRRDTRGHLSVLAWSGLVLTALVFTPPYPNVLRFYWPYAPLFLAAVSASLLSVLARTPHPLAGATGSLAVLAGFILLAPRGATAPLLPIASAPPVTAWLTESTAPTTLIASDVSQVVAWQARRPSVRFRGNLGVMAQLDRAGTPIGALHSVHPQAPFRSALVAPPLSTLFLPVRDAPGTLFVRAR
jgi:4-amino-4-deoxy-L-arabinose transferase-like glycosyltransferase